ncbi:alpha/beta hydrolase [Streptomyces sp. NPDC088387]|uniref:alpha/beta hydrolase n=1 Tax=Streptomyces sp. NPDC088387 TaxID=3365859 RepID=UPI0038007D28
MPDEMKEIFGEVTRKPPYDPELAPFVHVFGDTRSMLSYDQLPAIRQTTAQTLVTGKPLDLTVDGKVTVEERQVPGPQGAPDITLLILRPSENLGPKAALYHIHGGGMFVGDRRLGVDALLSFVAAGKAVVVSVEYRLAPEHPDPAPVEDCYAGLVWTARNTTELGIDPERLIVVGGSAGGGLSAGTALLARDRGYPGLSHQVLMCPMLDDRLQTHSSHMVEGETSWDRRSNLFGWTALLGDRRGGPDVSPYAAPARAVDLSGLPRTYIDTGSAEPFRDEILDYAGRLSEAGVSVDLHMWGGAFHGFESLAPDTGVSRASLATRQDFIRRAVES